MIKSFAMQKVASRLDEVILLRNKHFKLHHFLSLSLELVLESHIIMS